VTLIEESMEVDSDENAGFGDDDFEDDEEEW
jgi:hypothetical protein